MWQLWQSQGERAFSKGGVVDPCAVWQLMQLSTTGACSQRKGPRFSAWQAKHVSLIEFLNISLGPAEPWAAWQSEHVISPAPTGCVEMR